jgi:putative Ca2+/H+ antiporter (TMEM165/GDT1 family)
LGLIVSDAEYQPDGPVRGPRAVLTVELDRGIVNRSKGSSFLYGVNMLAAHDSAWLRTRPTGNETFGMNGNTGRAKGLFVGGNMQTGFLAFLFSAFTVVLAEMGDKTQLLAMAFAARYQWWKVLAGVFVATILNHALAVALGNLLGRIESLHMIIQIVSSCAFILFGLWTLNGDKLDGEDTKVSRFGPLVTVGIAFFIAELGDKTQLATIALATRYPANPLTVLMGTTMGMVLADGFGILVGVVLCRRIPERIIKIVSASVFMIFGIFSTHELLREELAMALFPRMTLTTGLVLIAGTLSFLLARRSRAASVIPAVKKACEEKESERTAGGPAAASLGDGLSDAPVAEARTALRRQPARRV